MRHKRNLIIAILLFTFFSASSQIDVLTNYPSNVPLTLFQLNDFKINNLESNNLNVKIEINLSDHSTGEKILFEALEMALSPGLNSLIGLSFKSQYFDNYLSQDFNRKGILDDGSFNMCVNVIVNSNYESPIRQCELLNISDEHHIHLVSPFNEEEIETLNPFLQWISSYKEGTFYHIRLVPLFPYKSPEEALSENITYLDFDINDLTYLYPFSSFQLEYGKKYAWQVYALSKAREIIGYSECWIFTPIDKLHKNNIKNDCYRLIHRDVNNGLYIFDDNIKFGFDNRANDKILNYTIVDLSTGNKIEQVPVIKLIYGLNKIDIQLKDLPELNKEHNYLLEIKNKLNDRFSLKFIPTAKEG